MFLQYFNIHGSKVHSMNQSTWSNARHWHLPSSVRSRSLVFGLVLVLVLFLAHSHSLVPRVSTLSLSQSSSTSSHTVALWSAYCLTLVAPPLLRHPRCPTLVVPHSLPHPRCITLAASPCSNLSSSHPSHCTPAELSAATAPNTCLKS